MKGIEESARVFYGKAPARWAIRRFKHIATVREGQVDPENSRYRDLPLFAPNHMESGTGRLSAFESAGEQGAESGKYLVDAGDVIYSKIRPALRKVALAPCVGLCSADVYPIKPRTMIEARFLLYSMLGDGFYRYSLLESDRVAMPKINRQALGECAFLVPPRAEQRAIADFLDRKTAAIDALIAKKERLVELLQEKRQALITQAVTKGLDPSAPMKDSGVEWLPQLPSHWQLLAMARVTASMCDGPFGSDMKSSHYSETGVRLVRLQNIGAGTFRDDDQSYVPEEHFAALPGHDARPGDLLVAGLGDEHHAVGRACVLPPSVPIAMVKADCFRVRLHESRLTHSFASWFLNSAAARNAVALETRGATRSRMNLSGFSRIRVPIPPLDEQHAISAWVERRMAATQEAMAYTEYSVERLREYRQALITAAVTGKVDLGEAA